MLTIHSAIDVVFHATDVTFKYTSGARVFQFGPLRGYHYDRPLWWETDAFQVTDEDPKEVIDAVRSYQPGPHFVAVATTDPEGVVHPYQELGYKTLPEEGVEIVMGMELKESASRGT